MSRGKKKPVVDQATAATETATPAAELNELMSAYRETALPTPVLLWRTEGKTVAAWELSEEDFKSISANLGITK